MSLITQSGTLGLTGKFQSYSPAVFGDDLAIWWDAENAVASGGSVSNIPNAGTLANNLTPVKSGAEPALSGAAGAKIITHDGADDCLKTGAAIEVSDDWTFYAVARAFSSGTFLEFGNAGSRLYFNSFGGSTLR